MNTQNDWIKRSTQPPTFPAWFTYDPAKFSDDFLGRLCLIREERDLPLAGDRDLWQPAMIPAPPKPESQYTKDQIAFGDWANAITTTKQYHDVWHAALAHERAWFRKELEKVGRYPLIPSTVLPALLAMNDRCAEERT